MTVLTVAGLSRRKGIAELIRAVGLIRRERSTPDVRLLIVGEGPNRAEFEALAAEQEPGLVTFLGHRHDVRALMRACTVFVLASHAEAMPLVLLEAREQGCAIVATDVDGNAEALGHGAGGVLVPPGDVPALAGAIRDLLLHSDYRAELGGRAVRGLDQFTTARMAADTVEVYADVVRRSR
jgi:glycosyltransferase involved in cell wall biosynthesis